MNHRKLVPLLALIGFVVPLSVAVRRPPPPETLVAPPLHQPKILPDPEPPARSVETPVAPPKTGRLRGRVLLPAGVERFNYGIYVYESDGNVEQQEHFKDSDHFELAALGFGKRAVVLFCPQGELRTAIQVLTIPEEGAADVELRTAPVPIVKGQVGDGSGKGGEGLSVEWREALDFGDFFQKPRIEPWRTVGGGGGRSAGRGRSRTYFFSLRPFDGEAVRHVSTDPEGQFWFPLAEEQAPVTLRIRRGLELIKEEVVLPQSAPFQLLIPVLPPPAKK